MLKSVGMLASMRQAVMRPMLVNSSMGQPMVTRNFSSEPATPPPRLLALNTIADNPGARIKSRRVGRGVGSGRGKTATRGHKGQKSRAGSSFKPWFRGGQTPLYRKIPKKGFTNAQFKEHLDTVNIHKIVSWVQRGRLDPSEPITIQKMWKSGLIGKPKEGVKLLCRGSHMLSELSTPLNIEVTYSSATAKESIEKAGGVVTHKYFNRRGLRYHLTPEKFDFEPKEAVPPLKKRHRYGMEAYIREGARVDHIKALHAKRGDLPIYIQGRPSTDGPIPKVTE